MQAEREVMQPRQWVCFFAAAVLAFGAAAARAEWFGSASGCYAGTIGDDLAVTMTLNGPDEPVAGEYRYVKHGQPIWLERVEPRGEALVLEERGDRGGKEGVVGRFKGQFDADGNYAGVWQSAEGKRSLPFKLRRIATLEPWARQTPRYRVASTAPALTSKSPFHAAVNARLSREAAKRVDATAAEFEKTLKDSDERMPWESLRRAEVLHADEGLVSVLESLYLFTGGAHGNHEYLPRVFAWRDGKLKEVSNAEMVSAKDWPKVRTMVEEDLKRQGASWPEQIGKTKLEEMILNPTAAGLVFTFPPYVAGSYAEGTYSVCIPYTKIEKLIPASSPLRRLMATR